MNLTRFQSFLPGLPASQSSMNTLEEMSILLSVDVDYMVDQWQTLGLYEVWLVNRCWYDTQYRLFRMLGIQSERVLQSFLKLGLVTSFSILKHKETPNLYFEYIIYWTKKRNKKHLSFAICHILNKCSIRGIFSWIHLRIFTCQSVTIVSITRYWF